MTFGWLLAFRRNYQYNTTPDKSGNSNTGTLIGATHLPTLVSGQIGNAIQFDGIDDYIQTGNVNVGIVGTWSFGYIDIQTVSKIFIKK